MNKDAVNRLIGTYPNVLVKEFRQSLLLTARCRLNVLSKILNHNIHKTDDTLDIELAIVKLVDSNISKRTEVYELFVIRNRPFCNAPASQC